MRLSTRFGVGAALAVLPLLGVVAYSLDRMQALSLAGQQLSERQVISLRIDSGLIARLDRLEEYTRKYGVSLDDGYLTKFEETVEALGVDIQSMGRLVTTDAERRALSPLAQAYRAFASDSVSALAPSNAASTLARLEQLHDLAAALREATQHTADQVAVHTAEVRERTRQTAVIVAGAAVLLSIVLLGWTVRSLRRRMDQFVRAHRSVSEGALTFQLDTIGDDDLDRVALAFNRMVTDLHQVERIKADFISSVSHELRTPLASMLETNGLLLEELAGPITPKQRTMLELNGQAARRLSNMITDLLDLSRLKAGIQYQIARHDVVELTRRAVAEMDAMALDRGLQLTYREQGSQLYAHCDADRFIQLVQNLTENALKYTPSGGKVDVGLSTCLASELPAEAHAGEAQRHYVVLAVDDTGPGIPEADHQRVFEKFFRRQGLAGAGGVGLGLAICREIAEAHGGGVWVATSALGGASLRVALPTEARSDGSGS